QVLLDARKEVEAAIAQAREAADEAAAKEARRRLELAIQAGGSAAREAEPAVERGAPGATARVGSRVRIAGGAVADVAEIRPDGRLVAVAGVVRMVLDPDDVEVLPPGEARQERRARAAAADLPEAPGASEVDLRGLT